ncbi:MAG: hypothetical protein A2Y17_13155 [Clostridiales bacterium GWF2_38_85]|nr:MAG: hypothetical protein A2Y17_13155 [Clostridiales bacterium GWF2_38_85]
MEYIVKTVDSINFDKVNIANIDKFVWGTAYTPKTYAKLIYVKNKGLALRITCEEKNPKAVYTKFYEPVYKDSCVEMFVTFDGVSYMNIEMNSNGATLIGFGSSRHGRTHIDQLIPIPEVKAEKSENTWNAEIFLPEADILKLYPDFKFESGARFKGNFYKCGDETEIEHYGMWSPVGTEKPDFHRPEYFGDFIIE